MTLDNITLNNELATIDPQPLSVSPDQFRQQVADAHAKAAILKDIVEDQRLFTELGSGDNMKRHLHVEAWKTIGKGYGYTPHIEWTRELESGGWEARCVFLDQNGVQVGSGEAECGTAGDNNWQSRASYQQRSMAQTRAISRAGRNTLDWVVVLAGYSATPYEEMDQKGDSRQDFQTTNRNFNNTPNNNTPRQPANPGAQKEGWVLTPCEIHPDEVWRFTGSMPSPAHTIRDAQGKDIKGRNGNSIWCNLNKWTESNISVLAARNDAIQAQLDGEELSEWRDKWVTLEPWRKYGAIIEAETRMRNAPTPALEGEIVDELACPHYQVDNGICAWCKERVD